MNCFTWNAENVIRLRQYLSAGHSTLSVAKLLDVTRNAVIGKAHRLGIRLSNSPRTVPPRQGIRLRRRPAPKPPKPPKAAKPEPLPLPVVAMPITPNDDVGRVSFEQLDTQHCKWPVGEIGVGDGIRYCGDTRIEGQSYCACHVVRSKPPLRPAGQPRQPFQMKRWTAKSYVKRWTAKSYVPA